MEEQQSGGCLELLSLIFSIVMVIAVLIIV
jgi:hypothetical protein